MVTQRLGIIMHGVTGRMGLNQHLIRSIVAIRNAGGVLLANAEDSVFFDAGTTQMRPALLAQALRAGKHVVADPRAAIDPWLQSAVDWDATIAYRRHIWSLGLGVAEAMDTAQRGMGLDWPTSLELIHRSLDAARDTPGALLACGCGTDHLAPSAVRSVDDVIRGYEEQMQAIEALGGRLIIMASRALARVALGPADYERVYARVLSQAREPVILHWLGDMFDPALAGYWGSADLDRATDTALGAIAAQLDKVDGIEVSRLDQQREIAMRRRLPVTGGLDGRGVRMYTGDDFNYAQLIAGDGWGQAARHGHSGALLGISHVERNGHHYVNGMTALPKAEQQAFWQAHPDLYTQSYGAVRLQIRAGRIELGSLDGTGFASSASPDFSAMQELS